MSHGTEGVWTRGWTSDGERAAVWHHHSGAIWAWECDLKRAGSRDGAWLLAVRPLGQGSTAPPGVINGIPKELDSWVMEPQLGDLA